MSRISRENADKSHVPGIYYARIGDAVRVAPVASEGAHNRAAVAFTGNRAFVWSNQSRQYEQLASSPEGLASPWRTSEGRAGLEMIHLMQNEEY